MAEPALNLDFSHVAPPDAAGEVEVKRLTPDDAADRDRAFEVAWRFLAKRDRTVAELRGRLQREGFATSLIDEVVRSLHDQDHLDDVRYARRFVEDRRSLDGWGSVRIEQRLVALGIEPELAAGTTGGDRETELRRALIVLGQRFPTPPRGDHASQRALGLLVRRGFDLELAHDALRAYRADHWA